jgi:hypothetical protein
MHKISLLMKVPSFLSTIPRRVAEIMGEPQKNPGAGANSTAKLQ